MPNILSNLSSSFRHAGFFFPHYLNCLVLKPQSTSILLSDIFKEKKDRCLLLGEHTCDRTFSLPAMFQVLFSPNPQRLSSSSVGPHRGWLCCGISHLMVLFALSETQWQGIWVTAGCEVQHQTPPERLQPTKGRNVRMCQPASHHVRLQARQRSLARSFHITDSDLNVKHLLY